MPRLSPTIARVLLLVLFLVFWELGVRLSGVSSFLLAPPSAIVMELIKMVTPVAANDPVYSNIAITIKELIAAYAMAAVVGVALGLIFASSKLIGDAFEPILLVVYSIPKIILYPLIILALGIGPMPKIVFGFLVGVFVIVFNTAAGVRQVDPSYIRLAHSLGYKRTQIFYKTILPAAAPTILAGLRLGFGYTLIGVMTAELLVVNAGLGFLIDQTTVNYMTARLFAYIVVAFAIGVLGNSLFSMLERKWLK